MPESTAVVDVERSISNEIQVDVIRSQDFEPNRGENAPTIDTPSTSKVDLNVTPHQAGVVEIEEKVEIPTENKITESTDTEQKRIPTETSVQIKVGDVVRTSDNQEGIVDHDYGDGRVGIELGNKFTMFDASELTVVEPAQVQEPTFKACQVVTSKKGFKTGVVQGYAKDGRLIVQWRVNAKQAQVEYVNPSDVQ